MLKIVFRFIFIVSFLFANQTRAQKYIFKQYTVDDGLAQSQVRAICQGEKGNLWIGTASGLSKFNGREFTNYSVADGLVDMQVNSIFNSEKGGVWAVTNKGLTHFNNKQVTKIDASKLLEDLSIFDASETASGMWLAVYRKGVIFLPKNDINKAKIYSLEHNRIGSVITTKNEALVWGNESPLHAFNSINEAFSPVYINDSTEIEVLYASKINEDSVYILSPGQVRVYTNQKLKNIDSYTVPSMNGVRDMFVDEERNIWISTAEGVFKLSPNNTETYYNSENGLTFEETRTLFKDNENNIWIGTDGGGLLKFYTKQEFVTLKREDGFPSDQIMSVTQKGEDLWFSTFSEGVFCLKPTGEILTYKNSNGLVDNSVWASLTDSKGNIWFGTSKGISKFDGKKFMNFSNDLVYNKTMSLYEDYLGRIWAGAKDGINIINENNVISISDSLGFYGYRTRSIKQDKEGLIWIGCRNGVFCTKDGNRFVQEIFSDSIAKNADIYSILPNNQSLFIASSAGLHVYNRNTKKITEIILSKKYFSNSVNFFIADPSSPNAYWAGRNDGVYYLTLEFDANGNILNNQTKRYSRYNGIVNLETNQNSAFFDSKGFLWFGTGMGTVKKTSNEGLSTDFDTKPEINITSFLLFLEEPEGLVKTSLDSITGLPSDLELKYNQNHITFNYEAISLSNPDGFVYRYKLIGLDGFEKEWSPITKSTAATFSNLSHGSYVFEVQASSIEGKEWSESQVFKFVITPPFWLTSWFILLSISISIGLFYLVYWIRMKGIRQKREAEQIMYKNKLLSLEQQSLNSSMNRHFIFNALNSIQYYINTHDRLSANKYLTSFAKLIRKNLESTNAHNNMTTLRDEIDRIQLYLSLEAMRFPDKITYDINVSPDLDIDSISIPPMFFQPYIENSIWHGILPKEKGHVQINIFKNNRGELSITIEDNGIGVSESRKNKTQQSHDSKGVEITKRRIDLLEKFINKKIDVHGPVDVFDKDNKPSGTKVEIKLPIENETFL